MLQSKESNDPRDLKNPSPFRIGTTPNNRGSGEDPRNQANLDRSQRLQEIKGYIHRKLIDRLDLTRLEKKDKLLIREQVRDAVATLCEEENILLSAHDRQQLIGKVLDEALGLGPLEVLLKDPTITDILVNGPERVYIERNGILEPSDVRFKDNGHLLHIIDKIVSAIGRRCDEVSPMVDARLPDGSRVNAIIPPLALDGPMVSIRRFGTEPVNLDNLLMFRSIAPEMIEFLDACVKVKINIAILGGTGTGKTTLLNNLSSFIPPNERIVTIEDAAELILQQPHVVRLESRPPNIEGRGQVTIRDLLINALRMRPDRIIVGECRGAEALDMLQAMNTGHEGSMTTVHANSPRDAISRVETMVSMAGFELPIKAIRQQFAAAINLLIQVNRLAGGVRRVQKISEVTGMEGETITLQDIFEYHQEGIDSNGRAQGAFRTTGIRPTFLDRLEAFNMNLDFNLFEGRVVMRDY